MLLDIKCSPITSIKVELKFDDNSEKVRVIGLNDLIEIEYNHNGLRKNIQGKVVKVSTLGADPKKWYIIVDGSDDFNSAEARISPMSILDCEIIRKADSVDYIESPKDITNIRGLRILNERLQYTQDGINWYYVNYGHRKVYIKDEEGTVKEDKPESDDDIIKDEN
jgi:hypothetical protein